MSTISEWTAYTKAVLSGNLPEAETWQLLVVPLYVGFTAFRKLLIESVPKLKHIIPYQFAFNFKPFIRNCTNVLTMNRKTA
jgi:hypothetical protein